MNKNKLILLFVISFTFNDSYSQIVGKADSLTRAKADSVINTIRSSNILDKDYALFSIAERWYLVIVKDNRGFHEYYLNSERENRSIKNIKFVKKSHMLSEVFNQNLYINGYTTFNSVFFKNKQTRSDGNITYFYLKKRGIKYGEARLSVKISPNPIKPKIYNFLTTELLVFMAKNAPDNL